ncbi:MAG TPA: TIGR01212 family radical SAM protein [Treponema sp.]|nr:TIGR01212 family radical SAM protein [Treponema sp.]
MPCKHYQSVSDFYRRKFGAKIYKLSIDAGCTCPTRDGTKGTGGCIFCSAAGSGDFAAPRGLSVAQQIVRAKLLVQQKNRNGRYIAYFQNFTNTYGDPAALEAEYREAIAAPDIAGISIATRPDCLDGGILNRIASLCSTTFVTIELGLQTTNEHTARYIRRGYENSAYDDAVRRIHSANPSIHVVTHVIFGLPGENDADMLETVRHSVRAGTDGIKITVLYVLRGTALAEEYGAGRFRCMEMEEYFDIISRAIELLPENIVVHRLTGDGAKRLLIAPLWTADKHVVRNAMERWFDAHDVLQGRNGAVP